MFKNLAIIPARGGSKRIPQKNIKLFNGLPILSYSIQVALKSGLFEKVMVSTDDKRIAEVAKEFGAVIPFFRSDKNSNDFAPLVDVLLEVINMYEVQGEYFDNICCILPTAPLIMEADIAKAYDMLCEMKCGSVCPVVQYSYPILRSVSVTDNGYLKMNWPEYRFTRSQDLKPAYHDTGSFYWLRTDFLQKEKKILTDSTSVIVLDELHVQDIDTMTDWKLAELKYKLIHSL